MPGVGVTRAQRSLTLSYCKKRKRAGQWQVCEPSRFIEELGEELGGNSSQASPEEQKAHGNERLARLKAMLNKG